MNRLSHEMVVWPAGIDCLGSLTFDYQVDEGTVTLSEARSLICKDFCSTLCSFLTMSDSPASAGVRTLITATLSVRDWTRAMEFYKCAFNAVETYCVPGGGVARLSVDGAEFWVAEESPTHLNFSPESLGGCSVRMLLIVEDPRLVCERAVAAGAKQLLPVDDHHGWRLGRIVDPAGHHWEIGRPLT